MVLPIHFILRRFRLSESFIHQSVNDYDDSESLRQSILSAHAAGVSWVAYFKHPIEITSARIEVRQDLFGDWSVAKYTQMRMTRKFFTEFNGAIKLAFKWVKDAQNNGLIKLVERTQQQAHSVSIRETMADSVQSAIWLGDALHAFTQHNDWVDMSSCLSLSADEYVDSNWKRFRDWLEQLHQRQHSDAEVYGFGHAVWAAYRQEILQ